MKKSVLLVCVCVCVKVSLAVADILVGLLAIPCAVLTDLGQPRHNLPLCLVLLSILMVLTQVGTSLWSLGSQKLIALNPSGSHCQPYRVMLFDSVCF